MSSKVGLTNLSLDVAPLVVELLCHSQCLHSLVVERMLTDSELQMPWWSEGGTALFVSQGR